MSLELRAHDGSCDWIPQAVGVVHRLVTADSETGKKYLKCWISDFQCAFYSGRKVPENVMRFSSISLSNNLMGAMRLALEAFKAGSEVWD